MIRHMTPADWAALDRHPDESADMLSRFAPVTFAAVVSLYCEMEADDAPTMGGRPIQDTPPL